MAEPVPQGGECRAGDPGGAFHGRPGDEGYMPPEPRRVSQDYGPQTAQRQRTRRDQKVTRRLTGGEALTENEEGEQGDKDRHHARDQSAGVGGWRESQA